MDLRFEAAALSEMAENTKADPDFRVPVVDWDRTARDVLTLEWIEATPGVVVVLPRVRSQLDRDEPVAALVVGEAAARAGEVGVQRGGVAV